MNNPDDSTRKPAPEQPGALPSASVSGSAASLRKPYPIWHTGLEEWVLVINDNFDDYADCRRADGSKWFAAKPLLRTEPQNDQALPRGGAQETPK